MATLADLIKKRRESGKSVTSSLSYGLKEKFKEKIDPRRFLDQSGILTALFPQLKAYEAGGKSRMPLSKSITPTPVGSSPSFDAIENNTKIAAKNTLVLPAIHRDINVMRQNIIKLVKLKGGTATNKADMYFMNAKAQEAAYESRFTKGTPTKTEKVQEKEDEKDSLGGIKSMIDAAVAGAVGGIVKDVVASAGSRLLPMVFSWASIPALGLALASQQAESADLNNQQQGIIDPIKRAYENAQKGDLLKVAEEIGNINVFTAAGRFGMETGLKGYDEMGLKGKHDAIRENNLDASKDMSAGQSSAFQVGKGDEGVAKAVSKMEKDIANEKDPAKREVLQKALDGYKQSYVNAKGKTPTPVPTPPQNKPEIKSESPTPASNVPPPAKPISKVSPPTPSPTPRNVAAVVDKSSIETKQAQEEISKTPIVNVVESTKERTINTPPTGSTTLASASVYDTEFIKLLGMGVS